MATYTTISGAETALLANLDFEEVASVSKAKACVSAANAWLVLRPESASDQSSSMTIGKSAVMEIRNRAQAYVATNGTTASTTDRVTFLGVETGFKG